MTIFYIHGYSKRQDKVIWVIGNSIFQPYHYHLALSECEWIVPGTVTE